MANSPRKVFEKVTGSGATLSEDTLSRLEIGLHWRVGLREQCSSPGRMWISGLVPALNKDHAGDYLAPEHSMPVWD
jgi:hypothetical protein